MSRLAEAEKKLQQAIDALESALSAIPSPQARDDQSSAAPDTSAIVAEMQIIDGKIEQAMTLVANVVAKAQKNGAESGGQADNTGDAE